MTEVLKNRKRKFVVEIITGTAIDSNGKEQDSSGEFIKYDSILFSKGIKCKMSLCIIQK